MLSIFDIYKIGVGPSSSHTNGPMLAGFNFCTKIKSKLEEIESIRVDLYGSLSLTGIGHKTDKAIFLGLMGEKPDLINIAKTDIAMKEMQEAKELLLAGTKVIKFTLEEDMIFNKEYLPLHENAMSCSALDAKGNIVESETYYSTGGGFISTQSQMESTQEKDAVKVAFPFKTADELIEQADQNGLTISYMILQNELAFKTLEEINKEASKIWNVMSTCIDNGCHKEGILEGGLSLKRRAAALLRKLQSNEKLEADPMQFLDWIDMFAIAVGEENSSGSQVVTSPTNGAAGVIPAVLMYYHKFVHELSVDQIKDFLAASGAMGILYKTNASISGAEVGCQGEIGVAASMAAAGLTALRGGSNEQVCMAAEIAMEHSLGLTCDPIGGLVQIPCIERNAIGAVKAVHASQMALKRSSKSRISLDKVIETMYQTGLDMNKKYRETSTGGLALIHLAPPCG